MLMALLLALTTARGDTVQKFVRLHPALKEPKCVDSSGHLKMRTVKLKKGGTKRVRDCVVDHIKALRCGGQDAVTNMQWQTYKESLAKDKTEKLCK